MTNTNTTEKIKTETKKEVSAVVVEVKPSKPSNLETIRANNEKALSKIVGKTFKFENEKKGITTTLRLSPELLATVTVNKESFSVDLTKYPKALILTYQFAQGQIIPVLKRINEGMTPKKWDEKLVSGEIFFGIPHNTASQDLIKAYAKAVACPLADNKNVRRCDVDAWVLENGGSQNV